MKKILILLVVLGVIAAAVMLLIARKAEVASLELPSKPRTPVTTVKPKVRSVIQSQLFLGHVYSKQHTEIATRYSSMVVNIPVNESQHVRRGDLLAELDSGDVQRLIDVLKAKTAAMQSEVAVTAKRHRSNETLYRAGAISEESYDSSRLLLKSKQTALEELNASLQTQKQQLPYYSIRAPYDGTVGIVFAHTGDLAVPGKALLTLHSKEKIARFAFPSAVSIEKNAAVMSGDLRIGTVSALYADASQGLFEAEVALNPQTDFVHGEMVNIEVVQKSVTQCSVPLGALLRTAEGFQLMQYRNGTFVPLSVELVAQNGDFSAVEPCPEHDVAVASAARLATLPFLSDVTLVERP